MQAQGGLTIEQMCALGAVTRGGFYRYWHQQAPQQEETELRARMQSIVLKHHRHYGYRRVSQELKEQGLVVNHKRVLRLMREDNLLAVGGSKYVATTNSRHDLAVYLNLAARMELTGINQLWVADLTYLRLQLAFVYLAVVLDAFSRRVVGWALDDSLHAPLALAALRKAIALRNPPAGLVHHTDQGIQYASQEYGALMQAHGIVGSMSRIGNPYDNAKCESFMKTLKQEQIYGRIYKDRADLEANLEQFLEQYYNRERLHSALNYRSPEAFENQLKTPPLPAARLSFQRHEAIYRSDVGAGSESAW